MSEAALGSWRMNRTSTKLCRGADLLILIASERMISITCQGSCAVPGARAVRPTCRFVHLSNPQRHPLPQSSDRSGSVIRMESNTPYRSAPSEHGRL